MFLSGDNLKSLSKAVDKWLQSKNRVPGRVEVHITKANISPVVRIQEKQI
jgi:hypothetical protein